MTSEKQRKLIMVRAQRMFKEGLTIIQTAEKLGINSSTLVSWMYQQGIKLRPDHTQRNKNITEDFKSGMLGEDVAKKYGLSSAQVYHIASGKKSNSPSVIGVEFEMSFVDIGEVLGISERVVRRNYQHAIKKLKVLVVEFDIELDDIVRQPERWREQ